MTTETPPDPAARNGKRMRAAGMLAAGAVAGGIVAGTLTANADSSGSTGSAGNGATATTPGRAVPPMGMRPPAGALGAGPVRSDESTPSSDVVATLTKKAEAEVSGGTVLRVETDAGDGAYEAHMQKADGTMVTVKFDKNLDVIRVEDGMGLGDPMPHKGAAPPAPSSPSGAA